MNSFTYFLYKNWIRFIVAFMIGLTFFLIYLGVFTNEGSWTSIIHYSNACFMAGFVLLMFSALVVLNFFGGFDIFSFYILRKPHDSTRKENFYEYCERKKEERKPNGLIFIPYLFSATLYLIAAVVTYLVIIL